MTGANGDHVVFNKDNAQLSLSAGIVYKFMTSNGTHNFKVWNVGAVNGELIDSVLRMRSLRISQLRL